MTQTKFVEVGMKDEQRFTDVVVTYKGVEVGKLLITVDPGADPGAGIRMALKGVHGGSKGVARVSMKTIGKLLEEEEA